MPPGLARWIIAPLLLAIIAIIAWPTPAASAEPTIHEVQQGQTLGGIAKRYGISINALCKENRIQRKDTIHPGQRLTIPQNNPDPKQPTPDPPQNTQQQRLEVPTIPPVYFYEPIGKARRGLQPVFMLMHGRGANPSAFCARWAPIVQPMGWLLCPSAPHPHGTGYSWANDWVTGRHIVRTAHQALRDKYGRRVQLYGNTLIGFSEGAFVAMNLGVREAKTYNRWLVLGADDRYWGAAGPSLLQSAQGRMRRVYLITGKLDGVHDGTLRTQDLLRKAGITVRISDPDDMGHVVELERRKAMYQAALTWLDN